MQNILQTIKIPKSHFDKTLIKAEKIDSEIKTQEEWLYSNQDTDDVSDKIWEKVNSKVKNMKDKRNYFYSMYSFVSLIDKVFPRSEVQQIDVTKIFISEDTYNKMKDHDRKLLNIIYKDILSESKIEQELGMLHLFSGFSISKEVEDNNIYINEGFLRDNS